MTWLVFQVLHALIWCSVAYVFWGYVRAHNRQRTYYVRGQHTMIYKQHENELTDITGEIRGETERAWRFFDGKIIVWLPKSQCEWDENDKTMTLPVWLAKDKELI
jgi:hypothetical protein